MSENKSDKPYLFQQANEFWKLRTKIGRDRLFSDPETLKIACYDYFQELSDKPLIEVDYKGKDAIEVQMPKMRAFNIKGLCAYLGVSSSYFYDFLKSLEGKTDEISIAFSETITHVMDIAHNQKFQGGAAGLLNPSFIGKDLSMIDLQEVRQVSELSNRSDEEIQAKIDKLLKKANGKSDS